LESVTRQRRGGKTLKVKFIGLVNLDGASEIKPSQDKGAIDIEHMVSSARSHEAAGFDRVLLAQNAASPDPLFLAAYLAERTSTLKFMVAHRTGFVAPTWAARSFATFDALFPGRVGIHIISGGADTDQRADGDFLGHGERYRRTAEWLEIFHKAWTSPQAFDFEGTFYRFEKARSELRPDPVPPIFFAGASDAAIAAGARHANIWALFGEPLAETSEIIERIRNAAVAHGRARSDIQFMMSLRPVVGDTEQQAWDKANAIIDRIREQAGGRSLAGAGGRGNKPQSHGSERLRRLDGQIHDKRLWTELSKMLGGRANTTGLVGTAEQIAESMADYARIGIGAFLIRGFDPDNDPFHYGRDLIPAVHDHMSRQPDA
jgi:alkanesulfonate monooxygenase